jgi:hypothetical protein
MIDGEKYNYVSIYPERTKTFNEKIKPSEVIDYVRNNLDLLSRKHHTLRGWYNPTADIYTLQVNALAKDGLTQTGAEKVLEYLSKIKKANPAKKITLLDRIKTIIKLNEGK